MVGQPPGARPFAGVQPEIPHLPTPCSLRVLPAVNAAIPLRDPLALPGKGEERREPIMFRLPCTNCLGHGNLALAIACAYRYK